MKVDQLEAVMAELVAGGRRPKFIYSIPSFQNPAGVTLSLERRRRLVELAREHEILIAEDNPYGLLRYEASRCPPCTSSTAATLSSTSEPSPRSSPRIRLGWAVAPPPVMEKIILGSRPPTSAPRP